MLSGDSSKSMRAYLLIAGCLLLGTRLLADEPTAVERLTSFMTGTFSSAQQARGDQNFRDVTLNVARLWSDRLDGPWLYAEQALTDAPDHPYRQRIFHLSPGSDGSVVCRVFDLPDPIAATGAWKDPARLAKLSPDALTSRDGCDLVLRPQPDGSFKGGTEGKACLSTLPGVAYTTNMTAISAKETITWERGYNASDTQIWGSLHGGYIFKRIE
jgi:hypothetical protein